MKYSLIIALLFFLASCSGGDGSDESASATWVPDEDVQPLSVEALEISRGYLIPVIETSGIIRGRREVQIRSETQGKITSLNVSLGDKISSGDLLLAVENRLQELNKDLAFHQLKSAEMDFAALEKSYSSGGISRSDFNSARTRLLQAGAAYESALKAYENTMIRAPFSGTVASLDTGLTAGNYITPGAVVARIIDTARMQMEVALGERQISLVERGQSAGVFIPSRSESGWIEAVVEAVSSGADSQTGSFPVLISWKNSGDKPLLSGLSAKAEIEVTGSDRPIVIPSSAIVVRDRKTSVLIAEEGRAEVRPVQTGESLGGHTEILTGLEEGELLIVSALSSLGNDYPVNAAVVGTTGDWR